MQEDSYLMKIYAIASVVLIVGFILIMSGLNDILYQVKTSLLDPKGLLNKMTLLSTIAAMCTWYATNN